MTLYRLHFRTAAGGSHGFGWFSAYRTAARAAKTFRTMQKDAQPATKIEPVTLPRPLTRTSLCTFLDQYAGHPDNG